ncbi:MULTISPECIES: glutamine amidotransferase [Chelatococcus]|uniref:GMP synthase (Glutamine-hydrolyzing) n=1 Tax=Chelatococcus caeni TaxID=1348468 RepID=A0A840C2S4_9HYPH|nr:MULTISPECIES: glutamine amidotransferase [Chelatococcus]ALA17514.1 glutamine amidotransferase [Chelatococcus sp. CO-6]MBB4019123.1 GMP synthase (glutamine-hydrolyzing) [Chelatococcus caeni]
MAEAARLPVLIVLHQEHSTPGRVGRLLAERGHLLDIRRPRFGDPLPQTLELHAGAVVFGGPMSANDPDDWVKREIDWIGVALDEKKPLLGLCLGAQMLSKHLGGRVDPHPSGLAEIGYYPLKPTTTGRRFASETGAPWPSHVYQWHREGLDCPPGGELLAEGADFPNQAFRVGPAAFGLQFHPEVTHAMIYRWTTRASERLSLPGAQASHLHHRGRFMYDPAVALWLDAFLDHWLAAGAAPARPQPASGLAIARAPAA